MNERRVTVRMYATLALTVLTLSARRDLSLQPRERRPSLWLSVSGHLSMKVAAAKINRSRAYVLFVFFFFATSTPRKPCRAEGADVIRTLYAVGLGIYGDSNSESEEEQSEHAQVQNDDSDEELMVRALERITRRRIRGYISVLPLLLDVSYLPTISFLLSIIFRRIFF